MTVVSASMGSEIQASFSPRVQAIWAGGLISEGRSQEAEAYAEHLIDQAALVLRGQDIGVLAVTPPLLERLARREELVDLVNTRIRAIRWGGTRMDPDSRNIYKTEVFLGQSPAANTEVR